MAMDTHLQQRIVGAIVLVTLGVIFIPALLDGSGYRGRQVQDIEVKEKPRFQVDAGERPKLIPTPVEQNRKTIELDRGQDKQQLAEQPIQAFALQVGTFDSEDNATRLKDKLKAAGYVAFIPANEDQKSGFKVRIGPQLERDELEKIKQDVKKKFDLEGYIVNYP